MEAAFLLAEVRTLIKEKTRLGINRDIPKLWVILLYNYVRCHKRFDELQRQAFLFGQLRIN